jgi:hypothetical protein
MYLLHLEVVVDQEARHQQGHQSLVQEQKDQQQEHLLDQQQEHLSQQQGHQDQQQEE